MTSKRSPQHAVTSAAYLLFYRRRSDRPLGGPFFEKIIEESNRQDESSAASSRASSPAAAGDERRFGDSSRVGSSSDYLGVEAGVGVGASRPNENGRDGGRTGVARVGIDGDDDELPPIYSSLSPKDQNDDVAGVGGGTGADQNMDRMDVDEGIDTSYSFEPVGPFAGNPSWAFNDSPVHAGVTPGQSTVVPLPASSDEDLMDGASDKAADGSSTNLSERGDRMADFADDDEGDVDDDPVGPLGKAVLARRHGGQENDDDDDDDNVLGDDEEASDDEDGPPFVRSLVPRTSLKHPSPSGSPVSEEQEQEDEDEDIPIELPTPLPVISASARNRLGKASRIGGGGGDVGGGRGGNARGESREEIDDDADDEEGNVAEVHVGNDD